MTAAIVAGALGWGMVLALAFVLVRRPERLAAACHEVRGPLAAAQLGLHASARRGEVPPTVVASLELELRRASVALDDLRGGRARSREEVDIDALLTCQARTWGDVAEAHGGRLTVRVEAGGALVHADAIRLAQAVGNVLANAIEHGGGQIELRTRRVADRVRVEVTDGGNGLPAPVAELVSGGRRRGERGRGLAIAARAVEQEGGRLLSLPSPGGARLALELPLTPEAGDTPLAA